MTATPAAPPWVTDLTDLMDTPNLFPPLPSEVILPLAGFAASTGQLGLLAALLWTTAGSVVGALALYGVGALLGRDRCDTARRRCSSASPPSAAPWAEVTTVVCAYSKAVLAGAGGAVAAFAAPSASRDPYGSAPKGARGCIDMRLRHVGATSHNGAAANRQRLAALPAER